eukprot:GHVU01137445.1.p1 GENE.GHVU01137445.1~~GHVU01137445.1.p1  ORF type:complete len:338 (+),score=46.38 GHVU01137445.1:3715-4728(+)
MMPISSSYVHPRQRRCCPPCPSPSRKYGSRISLEWWAALRAMHPLLRLVKNMSQKLQFGGLLIQQQETVLKDAIKQLESMASLVDTRTTDRACGDDEVVVGYYWVRPRMLSQKPGLIAPSFTTALSLLRTTARSNVLQNVGVAFASTTDYLQRMLEEYGAAELPAVDPQSFANLDREQFIQFVENHRPQLKAVKGGSYDAFEDRLIQDWERLRGGSVFQSLWKVVTNKNKKKSEKPQSFGVLWGPFQKDCPTLREVAGMLATAYPGITDVERHFSKMRYFYNKWRNRLAWLSLEGCFHCQQYWRLVLEAGKMARRTGARVPEVSADMDLRVQELASG